MKESKRFSKFSINIYQKDRKEEKYWWMDRREEMHQQQKYLIIYFWINKIAFNVNDKKKGRGKREMRKKKKNFRLSLIWWNILAKFDYTSLSSCHSLISSSLISSHCKETAVIINDNHKIKESILLLLHQLKKKHTISFISFPIYPKFNDEKLN